MGSGPQSAAILREMDQMDLDGDGMINVNEFIQFMQEKVGNLK